jgi:hypothetical protein
MPNLVDRRGARVAVGEPRERVDTIALFGAGWEATPGIDRATIEAPHHPLIATPHY